MRQSVSAAVLLLRAGAQADCKPKNRAGRVSGAQVPGGFLCAGRPGGTAAYEDILASYRYLLEQKEQLGIEAEKIGVAGDSTGASLAALLCSRYEQERLERPRLQMLIYPLTDIRMQTDSMKQFTDTPLWNARNNRRMWRYYWGHLQAKSGYSASPMHCPLPRDLLDTYIETAEYDCLRDLCYARKLREAGADVIINETKGTIHGYDCALNTQIARRAIEQRVLFLKKGFASFAGG